MTTFDSDSSHAQMCLVDEMRSIYTEDQLETGQSVDPAAVSVYQSQLPQTEAGEPADTSAPTPLEEQLQMSIPSEHPQMSVAPTPGPPALGGPTAADSESATTAPATAAPTQAPTAAPAKPAGGGITGSVGRGGRNKKADVEAVQKRLNERGLDTGGVDGVAGGDTIKAIKKFQASFLKKPDGLIENSKISEQKLFGESGGVPEPVSAPAEVTQAAPAEESLPFTAADIERHDIAAKNEAGVANADAAGKPKDEEKKPKEKPNSKGLHKTKGPADLVATFGTAKEAGDQQASIKVAWTDGLEKKGKKTVEKPVEELKQLPETAKKINNLQCHKKMVPIFQDIFGKIEADGNWRHILQRPGSYCPRQNRNAPDQWSIHSWGTAVDVNAKTNPNGGTMPSENQEIIGPYFTSAGFTWLEHSDAMHFQYHDGGAPNISDADIEDIKASSLKGNLGEAKRSLANDIRKVLDKVEAGKKKMKQARVDRLKAMLAAMEAG